MKKAFALLLTIALIATLTVASFANSVKLNPSENSSSKDLGVSYQPGGTSMVVYAVDVTWTNDLTFSYDAGVEGDWDPATHKYGDAIGAGWTVDTVEFTVTNHSNAAINASISVNDVDKTDDAKFDVSGDKKTTLPTADGTAVDAAPSFTFAVKASGTPSADLASDSVAVATATISFTKVVG